MMVTYTNTLFLIKNTHYNNNIVWAVGSSTPTNVMGNITVEDIVIAGHQNQQPLMMPPYHLSAQQLLRVVE